MNHIITIFWLIIVTIVTIDGSSNAQRNQPFVTNNNHNQRRLEPDDVFISVKTTGKFHASRVQLILDTWWQLAPRQTYFFTDIDDQQLAHRIGRQHLLVTPCLASHSRRGLSCKMSHEFEHFLRSPMHPKWFCHFDDDNYVNVPRLYSMLERFDPTQSHYLGKPSIRAPLELEQPAAAAMTTGNDNRQQSIKFWFATGGAGFCLSRSMAQQMLPYIGEGQFTAISERIRLPDDVTVGYIIEHKLGQHLTVIDEFHSHLEPMQFLRKDTLSQQISFSYSQYGNEMNVLAIDSQTIDAKNDHTKLRALHCYLFPHRCRYYRRRSDGAKIIAINDDRLQMRS